MQQAEWHVFERLLTQLYDLNAGAGLDSMNVVRPKCMCQLCLCLTKFLAVKGPRGAASHFWVSRALQSFISTIPKMCCAASAVLIGDPN